MKTQTEEKKVEFKEEEKLFFEHFDLENLKEEEVSKILTFIKRVDSFKKEFSERVKELFPEGGEGFTVVRSLRNNKWKDEDEVLKKLKELGYEEERLKGFYSTSEMKKNIIPQHFEELDKEGLIEKTMIQTLKLKGGNNE